MPDEATRKYFDALAGGWEERYQQSFFFRQRYTMFAKWLDRSRALGTRALDYGCGAGVLTELLTRHFKDVVATDLSEEMLAQTRRRYTHDAGVRVVSQLSASETAFDVILCSSVVEYVTDPSALIRELVARLSPNGVLLMTFAHRWGPVQAFNRHVLSHLREDTYTKFQNHTFSSSSVLSLAREAGLSVEALSCPIGLPLLRQCGLGELLFLVARRAKASAEISQ